MLDLRKQFFEQMCELAEKDSDVILLIGDLGFSFMETYAIKYSGQFINAGCIEGAMVGIAAGLALGGKNPYVYSTAPFLVYRALEQIRDDVAYNNLNVKLIGTGASGFLGFSHNLMGTENEEDLFKNFPNIKRFYPKNESELREALSSNGCAYIRI